ncbi:hypothetical protein QD712_07615 [Streptomyces acidiscabies]|uniref:hypothetical protein n=1 Tax=Streptomyces acidiscabies TaxID=42234 RepID=UPI0030CE4468
MSYDGTSQAAGLVTATVSGVTFTYLPESRTHQLASGNTAAEKSDEDGNRWYSPQHPPSS